MRFFDYPQANLKGNMLTSGTVEAMLAPISAASPCGENLEYDPAFTALASAAQGKPEQQFGATVIAAVEPDWRAVSEQAQALLYRAKDVRAAMLLLRASVHLQGLAGFGWGIQLLIGLLERFWDGIHPALEAEDDHDPTMRLNALAPLSDDAMVVRDLYDAGIGMAQGMGSIRVRDIAIAHNALAAGSSDSNYSLAQVQGALEEIQASDADALAQLLGVSALMERLQALLTERTGRSDSIDLSRLRALGAVLRQACNALAILPPGAQPVAAGEGAVNADGASRMATPHGEIRSRQDVLQTLDRVISYLEQSEPGNPAPLLIQRAKKLIGVSFLDIMANLAPSALDTIETVTGARPSS